MWYSFFSQIYRLPLAFFRRAMTNPMGIFIYGILSKWYVLVMIATLSVTFWVFKGLEQAGVIEIVTKELRYGFREAQAVAQKCTPKILNLGEMWDCIQNTSGADFNQSDDEKDLERGLGDDLEQQKQNYNGAANSGSSNNFGSTFHDYAHEQLPNPYDSDDWDIPTQNPAPSTPSSNTETKSDVNRL